MDDSEDQLSSRKNVFHNDAFDVHNNPNVDFSKIHRGKKKQDIDLEDKSAIEAVRATYDAYGSRDQESIYDNKHLYDDEYDDTYDTNAVGADGNDMADELNSNRVLPRVLMELEWKKAKGKQRKQRAQEPEDEEDDEDDEECRTGSVPPQDKFMADLAKRRMNAEMRRVSQQAARGGRKGRGGGPQPQRNVEGAPQGQGQSSEVQQNRRVKHMTKVQRKRMEAEKKMNKGMF